MKSLRILFLFPAISSVLLAQSVFPVRDQGEAPNRTYDVLHYKIEVSFDEQKRMVNGKVTTTLVPFLPDFKTIEFDAEAMRIHQVKLGTKDLRFDMQPKRLAIQLDTGYSFKDTLTVSIEYSCTPKKGLYFIQPDSGYPDKPWQIWTQGEDMDNHFWFPCYDFPNDKATSEVIATVRDKYTVLSNGKLVRVKEDKKNGMKTFHWKQSKPHASYLIMLAAGDYAVVKDKAGNVPVEYYVYPHQVEDAKACLRLTPDMIKFFSEKIGFAYPWEKYAQVTIADFMFGGMENTSATTMADNALVYDARARVDNRMPTGLVAHELAHQWWGDVVTCKDWRHLWLNESFASYFEPLYHEYWLGRDEFDYEMYNSQLSGINADTTLGRKPIVSVGSYGANVYPRGASVLHMLRFILGDQLFWRAINHYITKYQFTPVETNDFKLAIEEATGQNLYWFFDQWVYKAGHPNFNVSYQWSDSAKSIFLSVEQTQTIDSLTGVFQTPVTIEVTSSVGATTHKVNIMSKDTTFMIPSPAKPRLVIFDKGNWLLKELKFDKSREEWLNQAEFATNPVDRIRALQELSRLPNNEESISRCGRSALHDQFWAVRREAIFSLGRMETGSDPLKDKVKAALMAGCTDPKPAVRSAAIGELGKFKGSDVVATLRGALQDSSYSVMSSALRSLTNADSANALPRLIAYIDTPSYGNKVANTGLSSLAALDSTKGLALALAKARYGQPLSTRFTALDILSRYGKGRRDVMALYVSLLNDKNNNIRRTAARTLGDIGDETVLRALEKIADDVDNVAAETAKASLEKIKKRKT